MLMISVDVKLTCLLFVWLWKITFSEAPIRKSSITSSQSTFFKNSFDEVVVLVTRQA